ncbi:hypothetical protein VTI28DRAFT_9793 [Corynascus sepedonium]
MRCVDHDALTWDLPFTTIVVSSNSIRAMLQMEPGLPPSCDHSEHSTADQGAMSWQPQNGCFKSNAPDDLIHLNLPEGAVQPYHKYPANVSSPAMPESLQQTLPLTSYVHCVTMLIRKLVQISLTVTVGSGRHRLTARSPEALTLWFTMGETNFRIQTLGILNSCRFAICRTSVCAT